MVGYVEKMAQGDERAFEILSERSLPFVAGVIRNFNGGSREDAEEGASDVLFKLWKIRETIDPLKSLNGWLIDVGRNVGIDQSRKKSAKKRAFVSVPVNETEIEYGFLADKGPLPDEVVEFQERSDMLREALGKVPKIDREAVVMAYCLGYTQVQIAEQMRIPLGTAKSRVRRGINILRAVWFENEQSV